MKLILDYPFWIYFVCILIGVVFSFVLYRRQKLYANSKIIFWSLVSLRFILGFTLTLLLFNPLLRYNKKITEKPILVVLQDNSSSIASGADSSFIKGKFQNTISAMLDNSKDEFELEKFYFGEDIIEGDSLSYQRKTTNISKAIQSLSDKYYNQNLAAVVLISDGIYNEGMNPEFVRALPKAPIFTIALGDTIQKKDLILDGVEHNQIAFLGNKFPIKVAVKSKELKGRKSKIIITSDDKVLVSKEFQLEEDGAYFEETFNIEASRVGIQKYEVSLKSIDGEYTTLNNSQIIYVEVLNSRQKILLLTNAPHPDISAVRRALETNDNYKIEYKLLQEFEGNANSYDAIILHNLPSRKYQDKIDAVLKSNTPSLFILGNQVDYNHLANLNIGMNLQNVKSFTSYAPALNSNFTLFQFDEPSKKLFKDLPPLTSPFSTQINLNKQHILAFQKVGNLSTQSPLIGFYELNQHKIGYVLGEGIWRWRMQDFKVNQTHDNFNSIILKSIQYLSTREDKSFFRVFSSKNTYNENEPVELKAELYNKAYELFNIPEIQLEVSNSKGYEYSFIFSKQEDYYSSSISGLSPGNYSYKAYTEYDGEKFIKSGAFSVLELKNEIINTVANHRTLKKLSDKTNGQLYYPSDLNDLNERLKSKNNFPSVSYTQTKTESVINLKWIFALLLLLLIAEWFLRKREGGY